MTPCSKTSRTLLFVVFLGLAQCLAASVETYTVPRGAPTSNTFSVEVNGKPSGVFKSPQGLSFTIFSFGNGPAEVRIGCKTDVKDVVVRPLSLGITPKVDGKTVAFTVDKPRKLSVEVGGSQYLLVFADAMEANVPDREDPNVVWYDPGYHDLKNKNITLSSGQTLYLSGGAYLANGKSLIIEQAENVTVRGRGVLVGNTRVMASRDVHIEGIIINPAHRSWMNKIDASQYVTYRNYKAINGTDRVPNFDGFDVMSGCHHVLIEDVFVRGTDDCLTIKHHPSSPSYWTSKAPVSHVTLRDSVLWNVKHGTAFRIGPETIGPLIERITMKNVDVIHSSKGFEILAVDGVRIRNILLEDIRVEHYRGPLLSFDMRTWHKVGPRKGHADGIYLRDWDVHGGIKGWKIQGADREHTFKNVFVDNLRVDGVLMKDRGKKMRSVEDVVAAYPERMAEMLGALDLRSPGLAEVGKAHAAGDTVGACKALLGYYRNCDSGAWLRTPSAAASPKLIEEADNYLADIHIAHDGSGRMPREANGHLDWGLTGPDHSQGFRGAINRHHHLRVLLPAFVATKEPKYLERIDQDLRDWIIAADGRVTPFATHTLEPSLRMMRWPSVFYGMQQYDAFRPATRLLLLALIPAHARRLQEALEPHSYFATMQMNGLGTAGAAFPEFAQADKWVDFAVKQISEEIDAKVYPDGVQKELTVGYHWVALGNFERLANTLEAAGHSMPRQYRQSLERMYDYLAWSMSANGYPPMNSDSPMQSLTERILRAAERYNRPDWTWMATNGQQGRQPDGLPSRVFTWPGQLISRDGWSPDAQWSFFDGGPYGVSHQHNDKLHLSVRAGDRHLLVDSGKFAYSGPLADRFRLPYASHSRGHNVILVDGMGQQAHAPVTDTPHVLHRTADAFDFAVSTFDAGYDSTPTHGVQAWNGLDRRERLAELDGTHTRAVVYRRGQGWLVFDRMQVSGRHMLSPLWHFHPECTVDATGSVVQTTDEGVHNLRIQPLGLADWNIEIVKGQNKPVPQGWYSRGNREVTPSPCAVYETSMTDEATFAWLITTGNDTPSQPRVEWLEAPAGVARAAITWPGLAPQTFTVVLDETVLPVTLPNGRKLVARLLVEEEGKAPVVACGWLVQGGKTVAADSLPVEPALADLATSLALDRVRDETKASATAFRLPLVNARFAEPLTITLAPAADNGAGWRLEGLPNKLTLAPGESRTLLIRADCPTGTPRYPLPDWEARLQVEEEGGGRMLTATQRQSLPVIGDKPRLPVPSTTVAPTLDGSLEEALWQRDADVPAFGRMDLVRDTTPRTRAWLAADVTALYVAFACDEPKMTDLVTGANNRDDPVFRDDSLEILLEPDGDGQGRDYYQIAVSAAGVVYDGKSFDNKVDLPGLKAATARHDDHWTAEIVIPWVDLGLDGPPKKAAILLGRNRQAGGENEAFQFPVSPKGNHQPGYFARLKPLREKN